MSFFGLFKKKEAPVEAPAEPQKQPFKPFDVSELTHHIKWAERDLSHEQRMCEYVFNHNGIPVTHVNSICGVSITRHEYTLDDLKDYAKVKKLESQIKAMFMTEDATISKDGNIVSIEYPFKSSILCLGDMLVNPAYLDSDRLTVAIGRTTAGQDVFADIEDLKHILVAGTSGSGKSVFLQNLLLSVLAKHNDTDIYIIDPKRVEFSRYRFCDNCHIVTEISQAQQILTELVNIMEERYRILELTGSRDITSYNEKGGDMNRIIVMVDELGDLMKVCRKETEPLLVRLAQKSRACGIHLVLATQYPTADIVTGAIKQNMPTKVCFAVPTTTASVVMLGRKGAERLVGKGDMLYQTEKDISPIRLQAPYADDNDRDHIIYNIHISV